MTQECYWRYDVDFARAGGCCEDGDAMGENVTAAPAVGAAGAVETPCSESGVAGPNLHAERRRPRLRIERAGPGRAKKCNWVCN